MSRQNKKEEEQPICTNQFIHLSINSNHDTKINMELTPSPAAAVSSLLSHYQLQQFHSSRNNDEQNGRNNTIHHNLGNHASLLLKDKDKTHHVSNSSREGCSPNHFPPVNRNYPSTALQSDNNHENLPTQNLHHLDQNHLHGQHNIPEPHSVAALQSNETSKFFMSSLLNLSSGSAQQSSESSLPYHGTGIFSLLFEKREKYLISFYKMN